MISSVQPRFSHMLGQFVLNGFSQTLTSESFGHVMFFHLCSCFLIFVHYFGFVCIVLHFKYLIEMLNLV